MRSAAGKERLRTRPREKVDASRKASFGRAGPGGSILGMHSRLRIEEARRRGMTLGHLARGTADHVVQETDFRAAEGAAIDPDISQIAADPAEFKNTRAVADRPPDVRMNVDNSVDINLQFEAVVHKSEMMPLVITDD